MKKKGLILAVGALACVGILGACKDNGGPNYSGSDGYENSDWENSGSLTEYYFVGDDGVLYETLPNPVITVNYGENVFVNSPAVIDGKGNVLTVTKKISNRESGIEVVLEAGSFFAMDACGYTVDYTITLATGGTKTAKAVINVLGAENIWTEEGVTLDVSDLAVVKEAKLVNTNQKNSYNLTELLSETEAEKLGEYAQKGSLSWKGISADGTAFDIEGTSFDLTKDGVGVYTVYAQYATADYKIIVFADVVKFYDATTSFVQDGQIVGVEELTEKKDVLLLDLEGAKTYNLMNLLTQAEQTKFAEYEAQGEIVWNLLQRKGKTPIVLDGSTVDFASVEKANYGVYAHFVKDNVKEVVYGANVDFYDNNEDFVWSEVSGINLALMGITSQGKLDRTSVSLADNTGAVAGEEKYYQITSTGGSQAYNINLFANHSKEYYETFKGLEVYITFDMYMEGEVNDPEKTVRAGFFSADGLYVNGVYYSVNGPHRGQIMMNTWYTVKIPLDTFLLEKWEEGMLYIENGFDVSGEIATADETKLYVGNIQVGQNTSSIADGSRMLDLQGETGYDLLTLFDNETQNKIQAMEGAKWKLYPVNGGEGIPVESTVDFATLPKGYYTVSLTRGQFVVCGTNVDFYDSLQGFEWNTFYSASGALVKDGTATVEIVENPFGATGEYYKLGQIDSAKISFLPAHSDGYYRQYQGQGVSLILDYYLDTPSNEMNVVFCGYTGGKQREGKTWLTETIALDTLLENWETLFDPAQKDDWTDGMMTKASADKFDVYVGNIRFDVAIVGAVQDTVERLADFNGGENYDLIQVLSASGVSESLYTGKTVAWALTPVNGGTTVSITGNTATGSAVEKRAYNAEASVTVLGKKVVIYTGVVDFYDGQDGVVWNVGYSVDDITIKLDVAGVTKGVATNPANRTGSYYQITTENAKFLAIFAPAHTKTYYQAMQDKTFYFDVYVDSEPNVDTLMAFAKNSLYHVLGSEWVEVSINVSDVLSNWDNIFNERRTNDWKDAIVMTRDATTTTIYIGNFRSEANA